MREHGRRVASAMVVFIVALFVGIGSPAQAAPRDRLRSVDRQTTVDGSRPVLAPQGSFLASRPDGRDAFGYEANDHRGFGGPRLRTLVRTGSIETPSGLSWEFVTIQAARVIPHGYDSPVLLSVSQQVVATKPVIEEGTYVVKTAQGEYVGQSGAISRRLQQHVANGKFTQAEVDAAERAMVTGGKLQREIAEQLLIDSKGGVDNLLNKVNPIGPKRASNMPNQPYKR